MPALVRDVGEFRLIERLARRLRGIGAPLPIGIGDDAALLASPRAGRTLFSTDLLIEEIHFRRDTVPPRALGFKALEVSLSDITAMGGRPLAFFVTLSLPPDYPLSDFDALARGLRDSARRARVALGGGDTSASPGPVVVSIAVLGVLRGRPLRRDGARPGDLLALSGPLGAAATGLRLLEAGWRWGGGRLVGPDRDPLARRQARAALRAHLFPRARLDIGPILAERGWCRAAIDLSDGLASDLRHLCERSGAGAQVEQQRVPIAACARYWARRWGLDPWRLATEGGEDYELLLALRGPALESWRRSAKLPLPHLIGKMVPARQGVTIAGAGRRPRAWKPGGFQHFS